MLGLWEAGLGGSPLFLGWVRLQRGPCGIGRHLHVPSPKGSAQRDDT